MAIKLSGKKIRDCLSILDIMDQIGTVNTKAAAEKLQFIYHILAGDAFEIVYFWENYKKNMKLN